LRVESVRDEFGPMPRSQNKGTVPDAVDVPRPPKTAHLQRAERVGVRASIVVPTLNEVKRLGLLLEALGPDRRSRHDLEVIVSDGGSSDGTLEIALNLADRTVVHESPPRQTIAGGRNAGAQAARGRLLLFLNADVRLPDDIDGFLSDLLDAAERAGAATCRVAVHPSEATSADRLLLGACDALFFGMNRVGLGMARGECHAVRTSVFRAVGGYDEALAAGEDFDLFRRIAVWGRRTRAARIDFLWGWTLWEDPRRYRKLGYTRTLLTWFGNSISITFTGRSYSRTWEPIR